MEKRLAAEEANVANISLVQDAEGAVELVGIDPAQVTGGHLPVSEIAEVALGVTGVGHGNIADRWASATEEAKHVPSLRRHGRHGRELGASLARSALSSPWLSPQLWGRDTTVPRVAESDILAVRFDEIRK
jgi:hypothetical protein